MKSVVSTVTKYQRLVSVLLIVLNVAHFMVSNNRIGESRPTTHFYSIIALFEVFYGSESRVHVIKIRKYELKNLCGL